jgi:hypothetical protein
LYGFLLEIVFWRNLGRNARLQEPIESGANAQEHNDPEHRHDQSQSQTAREHQYVNEQNVDDNRSVSASET